MKRALAFTDRRSAAPPPFKNVSMTDNTARLGQPNPELEQIAGPQKIMLALAALGGAVFMAAMFYLLIVMQ